MQLLVDPVQPISMTLLPQLSATVVYLPRIAAAFRVLSFPLHFAPTVVKCSKICNHHGQHVDFFKSLCDKEKSVNSY